MKLAIFLVLLSFSALASKNCVVKGHFDVLNLDTKEVTERGLGNALAFDAQLGNWEECFLKATELADEHFTVIDGDYTRYKKDLTPTELSSIYFKWKFRNSKKILKQHRKNGDGKVTAFTSLNVKIPQKGDQRISENGERVSDNKRVSDDLSDLF